MPDSPDTPASLSFRLLTLGGLSLVDASGAVVGQQRRRLALLALLAAAPEQGLSREKLMAVLSPESSVDSARHSLHQLLYHLRQQCGVDLFLGLDPLQLDGAVITSDLAAFEAALSHGDLAGAVALYRGPFLDGFHLDSAEFEEWASGERARIAARHRDALFRLAADAEARRDHDAAIEWWRQVATLDPLSGRGALGLMRAMASAGDAAGALRHARVHEMLVKAELGAHVDAEVLAFVARLQSGTFSAPSMDRAADAAHHHVTRVNSLPAPNDTTPEPIVRMSAPDIHRARGFAWRRIAAASGVGVFIVATLVAGWSWRRSRAEFESDTNRVTVRSTIELPDSAPVASLREAPFGEQLAISPDGKRLVYVARRGGTRQLYVRELARLDATALAGTEGGRQPFFSPDGDWIGFFSGRQLRKISVKGGQPITLATLQLPQTAVWAKGGRILVAELELGRRLSWVNAGGGEPQPIARQLAVPVGQMELVNEDTWLLHSSAGFGRASEIMISSLETGRSYAVTLDGVVDRDSADGSKIVYGSRPLFLRSGHLVYVSDGVPTLLPMDVRRRRVVGAPVPIAEGIRTEARRTLFAISREGTLVYLPGPNAVRARLVWLDYISGRVDTLPFPPAVYRSFALLPGGRQIRVQVAEQANNEQRLLDLERGTSIRMPLDSTSGSGSGDRSSRARTNDGSAESTAATRGRQGVRQPSGPAYRASLARAPLRSPDGRHVATLTYPTGAGEVPADSGRGLWLSSLGGSEPEVRVASGAIAFHSFSPDGAWISYTDRSSGESEVYVAAVSQPGDRIKITTQTGDQARWTADGKTIVYMDRHQWYAVDVSTAHGLRAGRPRFLFSGPFMETGSWNYDMSADGRRFLLVLGAPEGPMNRLVVVTNWFADVASLAPSR